MSSRTRNWPSSSAPWGGRRNTTSPQSPAGCHPFEQHYTPLYRSVSETSPVSPLSAGQTFMSTDVSSRPRTSSRLSSNQRPRQPEDASVNPPHSYIPYQQDYRRENTPRSAPSITTSFPEATSRSSPYGHSYAHTTTSWPLPTVLPTPYQTTSGFSPVSSNPYNPWAYGSASTLSRQHTYMTSPTSYASLSQAEAYNESMMSGRGFSTSSAPSTLQRSMIAQAPLRRESEALDEFTSPTEFALFVEATSSLSISPAVSPNPYTSTFPNQSTYFPTTRVAASRLAAPLPPLPQQRSHSSPAPATRTLPMYYPDRSQILAEALSGMDEDGVGMATADYGSDEHDEELPNYEQSQAEASARQRREAARRAQELDEAWSRARRRR